MQIQLKVFDMFLYEKEEILDPSQCILKSKWSSINWYSESSETSAQSLGKRRNSLLSHQTQKWRLSILLDPCWSRRLLCTIDRGAQVLHLSFGTSWSPSGEVQENGHFSFWELVDPQIFKWRWNRSETIKQEREETAVRQHHWTLTRQRESMACMRIPLLQLQKG